MSKRLSYNKESTVNLTVVCRQFECSTTVNLMVATVNLTVETDGQEHAKVLSSPEKQVRKHRRIRVRVRQGLRLEKGSESRLGVRESRFPSEGGSRRVPRGTKGQPKPPERVTGGVEIPHGKAFMQKQPLRRNTEDPDPPKTARGARRSLDRECRKGPKPPPKPMPEQTFSTTRKPHPRHRPIQLSG